MLLLARPGEELSCRTISCSFLGVDSQPVSRGVISYYAARALARATTLGEWLEQVQQLADADVDAGRISAQQRPHLQVVGAPTVLLPGRRP